MKRTLNVDYYDLVLQGGLPGTPEFYDERRIERLLAKCAEEGIERVLWRLSVCGKEAYYTNVRTRFDWAEPRDVNARMTAVMERFDPLAVAVELAHRYGVRIDAWITLIDEYYANNLESDFVREHPECQFVSRDGTEYFRGTLCYAYPEVRAHRLAQMREVVDSYDVDGLFLSLVSHAADGDEAGVPDAYGYNEPVVAEYQRRHGIDIRHEPFDFRRFYEIQGEGLTQFLRDMREELGSDVPVAMAIMRQPLKMRNVYPRAKMVIDWQTWAKEGLIDELVPFAGEDLLGPDRQEKFGLNDIDPAWVDEAPAYYSTVRDAGVKLSIWCRVGDWYGFWPEPDVPGLQLTKPAGVISQIVRRLDKLGFDDVCFHEAWNVEPNDLWPALRGE